MKKLFKYFALVAILFSANIALVNAENANVTEAGDTDAEVTVGDVEVPVYDVTINWWDFTYDWKYNKETLSYNWVNHASSCEAISSYSDYLDMKQYRDLGTIYYDNECSEIYSGNTDTDIDIEEYFESNAGNVEAKLYYFFKSEAHMNIEDESTGGYISPSFTWTPEDDYAYTTGLFKYTRKRPVCGEVSPEYFNEVKSAYTSSDCTGEKILIAGAPSETVFYAYLNDVQEVEIAGGQIPYEDRMSAAGGAVLYYPPMNNYYYVNFDLGVDSTKTVTTPTTGETIGTVTISIETH